MPVAHITFGCSDLARAARFYDAVVAEYGGARMFEHATAIGWSLPDGGPSIGICHPFDGNPASFGNGTMIAVMAKDEEQVRRVHAAALAHGGTCEGPPGPRANGFYAAYYRDPDGNKMNSFCLPAAE